MNTYLLIAEILAFLICIWGTRLIRVHMKKKGAKYWLIGYIVLLSCISIEQFLQIPSCISIALIAISGALSYDTIRWMMEAHNKNNAINNKKTQELRDKIKELKGNSNENVDKKTPPYSEFHFHY